MTSADYRPGPAFDVLGKLRAAEAEVSRLRAVVARVEALADAEDARVAAANERFAREGRTILVTGAPFRIGPIISGRDLRAALRGDA